MLINEGNRVDGLSFMNGKESYQIPRVDCILNRSVVHRLGTLYFMDHCMLFISQPCEDYSISIDYDAIGVHAICRSSDIYQHACVYCQVSELDGDNGYYICQSPEIPYEGDDFFTNTNEEFVEGDYTIEEVLFSPEDPSLIETLFDRISLYQSLYSEGEDVDDDILQSGGEVAFDCNVEALFLQADQQFSNNSSG